MTEKSKWHDANGCYLPGNPGGPGRPRSENRKARELLDKSAPALMAKAIQTAMDGDVVTLTSLINKLVPKAPPTVANPSFEFPTDGSLPQQFDAIMRAVSEGKISPSQGSSLAGVIEKSSRTALLQQVAKRVARIEAELGKSQRILQGERIS